LFSYVVFQSSAWNNVAMTKRKEQDVIYIYLLFIFRTKRKKKKKKEKKTFVMPVFFKHGT